jgi:hypothetical protein
MQNCIINIREDLIPANAGEKHEKPFTLSMRFLMLLRAEQLLALAWRARPSKD